MLRIISDTSWNSSKRLSNVCMVLELAASPTANLWMIGEWLVLSRTIPHDNTSGLIVALATELPWNLELENTFVAHMIEPI